ncbi:class I SAM-dependent DNA methyltransferase [Streptomyces sulfonofaciens]|uniref:class I SAM-dependent DNA methyltransferase n=1 Tax=Streptomyces sulfonofaciens TaxID=68272 RepID=UPI001E5C0408|nr:class I SAM-dependent methyltransferase [Streptomyces sulfonofaciens]
MKGSEACLEVRAAVTDRTDQVAAFDAIGARYEQAFPKKAGQIAAGARLAAELPPGSRILDVGIGTGRPTARQLVDAGHTVVGVDLSTAMLELAGKNVPEAELLHRDLLTLTPHGRQGLGLFDGLTCFFTMLLLSRREIYCALRLFHSMLRPGGQFALAMVEADLDDTEIPFLGHIMRVSGFLRDELRQVVHDAGFEIAGEAAFAYSPARTDAPPEHQLFLNCRRA